MTGPERSCRLDKTGITFLGVRYQSEQLQTYMRRKDPHMIDVRWHPRDIGAIAVRTKDCWIEVPALDESLWGTAAQTWLTAIRHVSAANPKSNRLDNNAVREAIKAIKERNRQAKLASSLSLEDWSDERVQREERNLLAGVEFFDRKAPSQRTGVLGHDIPSLEECTGGSDGRAETVRDQRRKKAQDGPAKPSAPTIEED